MKRMLAAAVAVLVLLSGCAKPKVMDFSGEPTRSDVEFIFTPTAGSTPVVELETRAKAAEPRMFEIQQPEGTKVKYAGESGFDALYNIQGAKSRATVRLTTAPASLSDYYQTSDPEAIRDEMRASFFATDNYHNGLRKGIEDFEYQLTLDWTGTAFGMDAFYLEFVDEISQNHALRFYVCNGQFDESFFALTINADVPLGDEAQLALYRNMIFSLRKAS
jgi:hypothetical protein